MAFTTLPATYSPNGFLVDNKPIYVSLRQLAFVMVKVGPSQKAGSPHVLVLCSRLALASAYIQWPTLLSLMPTFTAYIHTQWLV